MKNLKIWLYGLVVAVISSCADTAVAVLGGVVFAPRLLRDLGFWEVLGGTIGFAALKAVFLYLKQSPLPPPDAGKEG